MTYVDWAVLSGEAPLRLTHADRMQARTLRAITALTADPYVTAEALALSETILESGTTVKDCVRLAQAKLAALNPSV